MTTTEELPPMEELLEKRRYAASGWAMVDKLLVNDYGPVTLMYHLQVIRDDARTLLARLERFERAVEAAGVDGTQVDA